MLSIAVGLIQRPILVYRNSIRENRLTWLQHWRRCIGLKISGSMAHLEDERVCDMLEQVTQSYKRLFLLDERMPMHDSPCDG